MEIPSFLFEISAFAQKNGQQLYLVGGCVRDYLLGVELADYDLICDVNALELARFLEREGIAKVDSLHEAFGTAKVTILSNSQKVDLATLRSESYEFPGALPLVDYPAPIELDLKRRDFTINALALRLFSNGTTKLTDLFDGVKDLNNKTIRVLHPVSYWEDPTRIIRAARFATRFGAQIAQEDYLLIQKALLDPAIRSLIERVRGVRVGIELKRLLELPAWLQGAQLLTELDAWSLCAEDLNINLQEPHYQLLSWQSRLAWVLWNNYSSIISIFTNLGIEAKFQKQIVAVRKIIGNEISISLKLLNEIKSLDEDFRNLLFCLKPELHDSFSLMQKALSLIDTSLLIQQGFAGPAIAIEMEKIFQQNFEDLRRAS